MRLGHFSLINIYAGYETTSNQNCTCKKYLCKEKKMQMFVDRSL